MERRTEDLRYCERLFERFYDIGGTDCGGVTRLGYTSTEDAMHAAFIEAGRELGAKEQCDEVGNTYISNTDDEEYTLIASHLDSVIDGGRYDGVAGVIAGLMVMRWAKEEGINLPLRVGAFRCEESSNFGCCTIGSALITKKLDEQAVGTRVSKDGRTLKEIFRERGYTLNPKPITGVKRYLELHIEQGKVLEETKTRIGIVQTIAGPRRFKWYLHGLAEHSGATPMGMRADALCAAAEIILALEKIGNEEAEHQSVVTVGVIHNRPNVMNVIPGGVELGVDIRGIDPESIDRIEAGMRKSVKEICDRRKISCYDEFISAIAPVDMSRSVQAGLVKGAEKLGITYRVMASGAGHDAMSFDGICETGMVFIPCLKGISHNHREFSTITEICDGARVLYEYLKGETECF